MRDSSIVAIIALLNNITIANGYAVEVKKVIRFEDKARLARTAFPALMVTDNDNEERNPKSGNLADVYFTINITGMVSSKTASTAMNTLDTAIKKAMASDRTLGGTVANVSILPRLETDLDGNESDSSFVRPVQVFYVANEANGE